MEISKQLKCIVLRNGIEIWAETERMQTLIGALRTIKESKFIEYDGQVINTADITGIFSPDTMDDYRRRKNGQWQCSHGTWHDKGAQCNCSFGRTIEQMYGSAMSYEEKITDEERERRSVKLEEIRKGLNLKGI